MFLILDVSDVNPEGRSHSEEISDAGMSQPVHKAKKGRGRPRKAKAEAVDSADYVGVGKNSRIF